MKLGILNLIIMAKKLNFWRIPVVRLRFVLIRELDWLLIWGTAGWFLRSSRRNPLCVGEDVSTYGKGRTCLWSGDPPVYHRVIVRNIMWEHPHNSIVVQLLLQMRVSYSQYCRYWFLSLNAKVCYDVFRTSSRITLRDVTFY